MLNKHRIILGNYDHRLDVVRFEPPLNVQKEDINRAMEALNETCSKSSVGLALGAGLTDLGRTLRPPK